MKKLFIVIILFASNALAQISPYSITPNPFPGRNVYEEVDRQNQNAFPTPSQANISSYNENNGTYYNYNSQTRVRTDSNGNVCYNNGYSFECISQ